jgi:hypothetical protein
MCLGTTMLKQTLLSPYPLSQMIKQSTNNNDWNGITKLKVLLPFQIVDHFGKSSYIVFAMYLDIAFI